MKIRFALIPDPGEALVAQGSASRIQDPVKSKMIVDMWRTILDEETPIQETNAAVSLLWIDTSNGTIVTTEQMSHAIDAPEYVPKYRPRTDQETWDDLRRRMVKAIVDAARKKKRDLALAALAADEEQVVIVDAGN